MYVDDIILIGNDLDEMERLKGVMAREFEIKDLRGRKGIVVSQRKMLSCKPFDTPMDQNKKIGAYKNGAPVDKGRYQWFVVRLIYISHSTGYCLCNEFDE